MLPWPKYSTVAKGTLLKKIVVACGSGVATSMAVAEKLYSFLDGQGLAGAYRIVRCPMSRVLSECADAAMLMATSPRPSA